IHDTRRSGCGFIGLLIDLNQNKQSFEFDLAQKHEVSRTPERASTTIDTAKWDANSRQQQIPQDAR
ncbi:hypothetical protein WICPIJ_000791, partial [Wickerhamomyces pijperi]